MGPRAPLSVSVYVCAFLPCSEPSKLVRVRLCVYQAMRACLCSVESFRSVDPCASLCVPSVFAGCVCPCAE